MIEAKKQGKLRYIGFTGHKDPRIHLYALEVAREHGFHFDTVQMPLNVMDAHYRSFAKLVVPELVKEGIGRSWNEASRQWPYLAIRNGSAVECLHYALNLPTSVVITGIDSMAILDQAFKAIDTFQPLTRKSLRQLLAKTANAARTGEFELFKTTSMFDGTAENPKWLGEEPRTVSADMPG